MVDMAGGRGPRLVVAAERPFMFSSMMDAVHLAVRRRDMKETELAWRQSSYRNITGEKYYYIL
jgi:hypothetical protein